MITAQQVLDMAWVLIDQVDESGTIEQDTAQETKALSILTILQAELLPPSQLPEVVESLDQALLMDDRIALRVLPYGLAAHLLMNEDQSIASYFNSRYDELKRKNPAIIQPISDVYGFM
jgi:hypothetical protein